MQECRICLEDDAPLISPCKCTGSMRCIHPNCLQKSVDARQDNVCEICLTKFYPDVCIQVQPELEPEREYCLGAANSPYSSRCFDITSAVGFVVFIGIVALIVYF